MADRFHAGISSSGNWWSGTARPTGSFVDAPAMSTAASYSCSTDLIAGSGSSAAGGFGWPATAGGGSAGMFEAKSRPCDESPGSNSSVTYQDVQFSRPRASIATPPPMLDAAAPSLMDFGLSSPTFDWNHPFFSTKTSGRAADQTNSFHALFQDQDVESNQMQVVMGTSALPITPVLKSMNQGFLHEEHPVSSSADNLPIFSSALLQGLFEPADSRLQRAFYPNQPPNFTSTINSYEKLGDQAPMMQSSLAKPPPPPPQLLKASQPKQQMQFSNETPFWNPSASAATDACSSFYHSAPTQPVQNEGSGQSNLAGKPNSRGRNSNSNLEKSTGSSEPVQKKARIETPSPLPTFKVRKEKLGDRITALQQLVSPFGKTDTASVLHEAIDYIKFLHDQVRALSAPYLKNGHQVQQVKGYDKSKECTEGSSQDLQSRGLCLVPISSTFVVASETPIDFWTPIFGGAYR